MNLLIIVTAIIFSLFDSEITHNSDMTVLKGHIADILATHKGIYAIAFRDLQNGTEYLYNENEIFHAASTMKTPVMMEIFNQVKKGYLSLSDSIAIVNSFTSIIDGSKYSLDVSDDSEDGLYSKLGQKESVYNLIYDMITSSSNFATNLLIEKIKADSVVKTLHEMNINDICVLRGVEDLKAFDAGKNNTTTAHGLMELYTLLAKGKLIDPESSQQMIKILLQQKLNDRIPELLPATVTVAHKTGSITNVEHDSGIIFLPDGRKYVLVILSKNLDSNSDGKDAVAKISKAFYDYMVN